MGDSPLRQLLDQGWNRTPLGFNYDPNAPFPLQPGGPFNRWISQELALEMQHGVEKAEHLRQPPPPSDQLRTMLQRQLNSAQHQLNQIEAGWQGRHGRRIERNIPQSSWSRLDRVLPDARARVDRLNLQLRDPSIGTANTQNLKPPAPTVPTIRPPTTIITPGGSGSSPGALEVAGKTGVVGGLLTAGESAGLWLASWLPGGARGLATRAVLGSSNLIYGAWGAVVWVGEAVIAFLAIPIVLRGVMVVTAIVAIGGVVYYMLPSGELVPVNARYAVVRQTTRGFDGGDIHVVPMAQPTVEELIEAREASTGQQVTVVLGPFDTIDEAADALCGSISPGSITVQSGVRTAQFGFDGRRYGLPDNPCD